MLLPLGSMISGALLGLGYTGHTPLFLSSSLQNCLLNAEYNTAGKRIDQLHSLAGVSMLQQQLSGLHFRLSPLAFFQTNTVQTEVLYNEVAKAAGTHLCAMHDVRA